MKITYTENPLCSVIELTEEEKIQLRETIRKEEESYNDHYKLGPGELADRIERFYQTSLATLSIPHMGDCTYFPFSCIKCQTEELLGVNTIPNLD